MSRIGKKPILLPQGVTVEEQNGFVTVRGPLGYDSQELNRFIGLTVDGHTVNLHVKQDVNDDKNINAYYGLYRSLIANMVTGVSSGFEKILEIVGVGYRATQQNKNVVFQLGYSHTIEFVPPEGIAIEVLEATKLKVKGINKEKVGQVAADIRKLRSPEPYKGKGIRYKDEYIKKKAGKAGKA